MIERMKTVNVVQKRRNNVQNCRMSRIGVKIPIGTPLPQVREGEVEQYHQYVYQARMENLRPHCTPSPSPQTDQTDY
jgi:hypothetical protein